MALPEPGLYKHHIGYYKHYPLPTETKMIKQQKKNINGIMHNKIIVSFHDSQVE